METEGTLCGLQVGMDKPQTWTVPANMLITDTVWVMVKHPINKEQHLMKCHRGAPNWIDFCNENRKVWLTLSM